LLFSYDYFIFFIKVMERALCVEIILNDFTVMLISPLFRN